MSTRPPQTNPKCILPTGCVHPAPIDYKGVGSCRALGQCGCAYALREASMSTGYRVLVRDNITINALKSAGLIELSEVTNGVATATAVTIS